MKSFYFFSSLLLFFSFSSYTQTFRFKNYNTEKDGLYPYIYSIHQDPPGFLWIGTGEGLYRFDGLNFKVVDSLSGQGGSFVCSSQYMDNGLNWFGFNDGSIVILSGTKVKRFMSNIMSGSVVGLFKENNAVYAFSQNGNVMLFDYNGNIFRNFSQLTGSMIILSVAPLGKQQFLVGTDDGLYIADLLNKKITSLDDCPVTRINCIYKSNIPNIWWAGTDDNGILLLKNITTSGKDTLHVIDPKNINSFINKPVNTIIQDKFNNMWIGTSGEGLFVFRNTGNDYTNEHFNLSNGLPSDYIKKLYIDKEENLWIGTYGNGLAKFSDDYFTFHMQGPRNLENNILTCMFVKDEIFFTKNNIMYRGNILNTDQFSSETLPANDKISALYKDVFGTTWAGFQNSGLYYKKKNSNKYLPYEFNTSVTPGNINYISGYGNELYVGSINGLYIINLETNLTIHISTNNGLPHNSISHIFIDMQGNPWIATPTNYLIKLENDSVVKKYVVTYNNELIKINSICQDISGKIWIATYGHGVFCMNDTSFVNYNNTKGLLSNYCYSITTDESNAIWVGHRQGLSCIKSGMIRQYGKNKEIFLDFNLNAACIDNNGWIWWGTSNGLVCYDFRKNKLNKIPPGIILESVTIDDKDFCTSEPIELPNGAYKIRFNFTGISMTEPELISYSYILEGFDKEWNEHSAVPYAFYPGLSDGNYSFLIKAYNSNGISSVNEVRFNLSILPPFWKRWWFILISVSAIIYLFYMIIKIRERNHKKLEEYLKKTLDERTLEVRKQKELIELKNKDITDSINYAKRIQEAILPSPFIMKRILPKSFFMYRPRDIVSGDFYIAQPFEDITVVIAADATGHGVPGAFMSLICSTVIKDILSKKDVKSPDTVLYELDREIKHIFNLSEENPDQPQDGLDITVCEINKVSGRVRISSAMRPYIIAENGKITYHRGSKHSIGGLELRHKEFAVKDFSLSPGSCIYLFTDGFADQFGGKDTKKFKISRFKNTISEISQKSLYEQKQILEYTFDNWKGNEAQVDDVLVIGIMI